MGGDQARIARMGQSIEFHSAKMTNAQFPILNAHPNRNALRERFLPSDESWELEIEH